MECEWNVIVTENSIGSLADFMQAGVEIWNLSFSVPLKTQRESAFGLSWAWLVGRLLNKKNNNASNGLKWMGLMYIYIYVDMGCSKTSPTNFWLSCWSSSYWLDSSFKGNCLWLFWNISPRVFLWKKNYWWCGFIDWVASLFRVIFAQFFFAPFFRIDLS